MCRSVRCRQCGKTGWAGCGAHVEQVLAGIPTSERCAGHAKQAGEPGVVSRLLGRLFGN
jgi:Na+-translocating ferredoxin:NAD+ oxidoreductase RNF subunit RnfB